MINLPGMGSTLRDLDVFNENFLIAEEERTRLTRCFLQKDALEEPYKKYVVAYDPLEGIGYLVDKLKETAESLYEAPGNPPNILLSIDSLCFNYMCEDALKLLSRISAWTRRRNGLLLFLDKSSHPRVTVKLSSIAYVHLKLLRMHGCLMLFGVNPRTHLYALQTKKETLMPQLIPIV